MNIEAYSYTVLSAILGILIVFGFLGFLCLFMILLKKVVDGKPVKIEAAVKPAASVNTSAADETDWITAAVAVYLEEEDSPRSALSWLPAGNEKLDPWVSTPRVQKTFSGV
jgi:Na+-transporting methylmalonyl-CoA/oxaloacetate decarboxylase gamma subunit